MLGTKDNTALEYIILEKAGALPDRTTAISMKKKAKRAEKAKKKGSGTYFFLFMIVIAEVWYLWNFITEKYPTL